jgi:hypothetical protein
VADEQSPSSGRLRARSQGSPGPCLGSAQPAADAPPDDRMAHQQQKPPSTSRSTPVQ